MARPIMLQGTASNVGKTILALSLCKIFKEDGYKVAPFKAQNITSNTFITENGEEIAVSQWLQALAAGIEPSTDMNPVLLKPLSDGQKTQVIINGKLHCDIDLYNFKDIKKVLAARIADSYSRLSAKYDIIVIEGAGSPVELNLNKDDIVNMGMARAANAPVILISDIDRGGVFASLYGTVNLLNESDKKRVKALIVNRFRGEASYFNDGVAILEEITGLPVAGVVPYTDFCLPEEDGLFNAYSNAEKSIDYNEQFNIVSSAVRESLDMKLIYEILNWER